MTLIATKNNLSLNLKARLISRLHRPSYPTHFPLPPPSAVARPAGAICRCEGGNCPARARQLLPLKEAIAAATTAAHCGLPPSVCSADPGNCLFGLRICPLRWKQLLPPAFADPVLSVSGRRGPGITVFHRTRVRPPSWPTTQSTTTSSRALAEMGPQREVAIRLGCGVFTCWCTDAD